MKRKRLPEEKRLWNAFPDCRTLLRDIAALREEVRRFPLRRKVDAGFLISDDKDRVAKVNAGLLTMWATHISFSAHSRMFSLESSILRELAQSSLLSSMSLARAHMEAAGLVAASLDAVERIADPESPYRLERMIPKTLLGSSLPRASKKAPIISKMVREVDPGPVSASLGVDALERYSVLLGAPPSGRHQFYYAFLCNFSHPNKMSSAGFHTTQDAGNGQEVVQYNLQEKVDSDSVRMALSIMLANMRIGYLCAGALASARFVDEEDGAVSVLLVTTLQESLARFIR